MKNIKITVIYTPGINSNGGKEYLKYIINLYSNQKYVLFLDSRINPNELNSKIPPTEHRTIAYVVNPSNRGAGTKNIATINLKTLSAVF